MLDKGDRIQHVLLATTSSPSAHELPPWFSQHLFPNSSWLDPATTLPAWVLLWWDLGAHKELPTISSGSSLVVSSNVSFTVAPCCLQQQNKTAEHVVINGRKNGAIRHVQFLLFPLFSLTLIWLTVKASVLILNIIFNILKHKHRRANTVPVKH